MYNVQKYQQADTTGMLKFVLYITFIIILERFRKKTYTQLQICFELFKMPRRRKVHLRMKIEAGQ